MLVGTTNLNTTLNLTYVLADVVETLVLIMEAVFTSGFICTITKGVQIYFTHIYFCFELLLSKKTCPLKLTEQP